MTNVLAHNTVTTKHRGAVKKAKLRKDALSYLRLLTATKKS